MKTWTHLPLQLLSFEGVTDVGKSYLYDLSVSKKTPLGLIVAVACRYPATRTVRLRARNTIATQMDSDSVAQQDLALGCLRRCVSKAGRRRRRRAGCHEPGFVRLERHSLVTRPSKKRPAVGRRWWGRVTRAAAQRRPHRLYAPDMARSRAQKKPPPSMHGARPGPPRRLREACSCVIRMRRTERLELRSP